jgi:hypothetical protein
MNTTTASTRKGGSCDQQAAEQLDAADMHGVSVCLSSSMMDLNQDLHRYLGRYARSAARANRTKIWITSWCLRTRLQFRKGFL